jgi:hypothetical protein
MYLSAMAVTALGYFVTLAQADPQKITLMSRSKPLGSRYRARAINSSTISMDDFFLGTDLQYVS